MANTPLRNVRVEDATWHAAIDKATQEHTSVSEVVRVLLDGWLDGRIQIYEDVAESR